VFVPNKLHTSLKVVAFVVFNLNIGTLSIRDVNNAQQELIILIKVKVVKHAHHKHLFGMENIV